jgi:outer membrane protein
LGRPGGGAPQSVARSRQVVAPRLRRSNELDTKPANHTKKDLPMTRRLLLTPLALALGFAGTARADDLMQVYEAAHAFDATYLAARDLAESAPYAAAQANRLRLPTVNASASATRVENSGFGGNSGSVGVSANQPLFNMKNRADIGQANKRLDISRENLRTAEQDLIVRAAQAYFDVLAAEDTLATTRTSKAAITEQLASAKRNFEVGTATITDTREAQARFDLATAQELAAENDLLSKRIALDTLVGRANVKPNPLVVPVVLPPVQPPTPEAWVGTAEAEHPSIRRARLDLDVAQLETDKARAGHLPTVDAVAGASNSRGSASQSRGTSSSIGVQLNLPLFAGFSVQNRVKETLELEEKARNDLEAERRRVTQSTRTTFFGVQSGQAQVKALEAAESSSKLALEATQLGYRVGVRVNLDVLNAQTLLFQTQRDLAKARYDVLVNSLKLRQAAGTLSPADLAQLNQLIAK